MIFINRWVIVTVMALNVTFIAFSSLALAQEHRTIMPEAPKRVVTQVEVIPGHWVNDGCNQIWVSERRIERVEEVYPLWITGYWERTGAGVRWVPGHWEYM